ncbi:MAG: cohesin domain-containing protein, partial [Methermicoccaceae archaeon]
YVAVQLETMEDIAGVPVTATDAYGNYYVTAINGETASGANGWMYVVNYESPSVGADGMELNPSDSTIWYYGSMTAKLSRLIMPASVDSGTPFQALVEYYNSSTDSWEPLEGAYVWEGNAPISGPTDANGHVDVTVTGSGIHTLWAAGEQSSTYPGGDWTQIIRSEKVETNAQVPSVTVNIRVESNTTTLFNGQVSVSDTTVPLMGGGSVYIDHPTALGALLEASSIAGFSVNVSNGAWGLYVNDVAGDQYVSYWVNDTMPWVGAGDYNLTGGENVIFATGNYWPFELLRISAPASGPSPVEVTVEFLNSTSSAWEPLEGATVLVDGVAYGLLTGADGKLSMVLSDGSHALKAEKTGYVRSEEISINVDNNVVMYISPALSTAKEEQQFTIDVKVLSPVEKIYGVQYTINYDKDVLEVVDQTPGTFLTSDGANSNIVENEFDNSIGVANYAEARKDTAVGVTGDDALAHITFRVIDGTTAGVYNITFDASNCMLSNEVPAQVDADLVNGQVQVVVWEDANIWINPAATTVDQFDTFTIDVMLDSGNDYSLFGAEYNFTFNPSVLQVVSITPGTFFTSDGASTTVVSDYNNTAGTVSYSEVRTGTTSGVQGSGVLATVTFSVVGSADEGDYDLTFIPTTALYDADAGNNPVSFTQEGSTITINNLLPVPLWSMNHTVNNEDSPLWLDGSASYDSSAGGSVVSYLWDFGDGTPSDNGAVVEHTYAMYHWDGANYVPYNVTLVVTDNQGGVNSTVFAVPIFMEGDVNGDGRVNIMDMVPIGVAWRTDSNDPNYSDGADLNNDNSVNIFDAVIVGKNWRQDAVVQ